MGGASYTKIPGSERIKTGKKGAGRAAVVEGADPASVVQALVDVDEPGSGPRRVTLGRVLLQGPSVPLLHDVVDRLFPLLQAEEVAVYVHLYRLAVDAHKNVCRISRAELTRRTRLADRRLGRAIAGLVAKQALLLIDRDRDGTLYRVMFPQEMLDTPIPRPVVVSPHPDVSGVVGVLGESDLPPLRSVGAVCEWFAGRYGTGPGRGGADVAACVLDLLEEGHTFRQIPPLLESFVRKAPQTTPLRDLARVLR